MSNKQYNKKNKTIYQEFYLEYELQCIEYHRIKYNHETYHWSNIPEDILYNSGFIHNYNELRLKRKFKLQNENKFYNPLQEYGLDGLSIECKDGLNIFNGIQSKYWNEKTYLTANDLGSFVNVIVFRLSKKNKESKGYLYYTCKLQIDLKDDFLNSDGIMNSIYLPFNKEQNPLYINLKEDYSYETKLVKRYYQIEAINSLINKWSGRTLLNLPCGTGKTLIFCEHLLQKQYTNVFIISPLRVLVKQNLKRISNYLGNIYDNLLIDSDTDGTRDFDEIEKRLNKKCIFSSTYESCEDILAQLFYDNDNESNDSDNNTDDTNDTNDTNNTYDINICKFDLPNSLLIVDECHNLLNKDILINIIKKFPKVLMVSATPQVELEEILDFNLSYYYPMRQAIIDGYICDYQIYLPYISFNEELNKNEVNLQIPIECINLDNDLCKKALFLISGLLKTGSKRTILYLKNKNECIMFKNVFKYIIDNYHYLNIWIDIIDSDISEKNRDLILKEFDKNDSSDKIYILLSIRILDEGIDFIKCDSIFFGNISENSNLEKTVQRICRGNRLDKNNPNKICYVFLWTDDINKIINALQLLKHNDVEFHKKIKIIDGDYISKNNIDRIINIENKNIELNNFINVKCLSINEIWNYKKDLLFDFCILNNRYPKQNEEYKSIKIGTWLCNQKTKIKTILDNVYIQLSINDIVKKELDRYLLDKDKNKDKENLLFDEKKNLLFEFCILNNKCPKQNEEYKNIKIGIWFQDQKKKIKTILDNIYIQLSNNDIVKKELDRYLLDKDKNKDKENLSFDEKKNLLFEFCILNNRCPKQNEEYKNIKIGNWFQDQKKKIKTILDNVYIQLSTNDIVKKELDRYLFDKDKEKLSFNKKKNLLFDFCILNSRCPKHNEEYKNIKIGMWLDRQKGKIKTILDNVYIQLSNNDIVKKELDRYLLYKDKNKDKEDLSFDEKKNLLFEFCILNNRCPKQNEEYKNIKIGNWFKDQKKKIKTILDNVYIQLSTNGTVKKELDRYLLDKHKKDLSFDEKKNLLFEFCILNNRCPKQNEEYKNIKIGIWFQGQKTKIKIILDNVYIQLSTNDIVKKELDRYLDNKKK